MNLNLTFWLIQTVAMMITAFLLPGLTVSGPIPAFATVAALAFINSHLWGAALFFHIPDSLGQHELLILGANAVIFWIVVKLLPGIEVKGIFPAIAAPVVFTIISIFVSKYEPMVDWNKVYATTMKFIAEIKDSASSVNLSPPTVEQSNDNHSLAQPFRKTIANAK